MNRWIPVLLVVVVGLMCGGCSEDDEYSAIIQAPTNNPISSVWRGTYAGTCKLSAYNSANQTRSIELRIIDLGDDTERIRAYLVPNFIESESSSLEGEVTDINRCQIHRLVEDTWYLCTLNKAGRFISGSITTYQEGHAGQPNWVINNIDVSLVP